MKAIPNYISLGRIIFSLGLVFLKPLSIAFYVVYIVTGLSDMVDGYIARKTGTTSSLGERLDSIADMVMIAILFVVLFPIVNPSTEIVIWVIAIAIIRLLSMLAALMKYKTFASLHTYGNKITGFILFIFPILLPYIDTTVLIYVICTVATLSAIEELIIQLTSKQLQLNKQSIFIK